jgi:co-chaperonin GroES (HSP10)
MATAEIARLRYEAGALALTPLADWVLIRPIDGECFKKTKLHLPAQGKGESLARIYYEMPLQGIVVAVGPGWMTDSGMIRHPGVNVGDHVAVDANTMVSDFLFDGVLYYKVRSSGVLCIFGDPDYFDKYDLVFSNPKE